MTPFYFFIKLNNIQIQHRERVFVISTKYLGDGIWSKRVSIDNADIMIPVEIQSIYSETIQTHNAVSISGKSESVCEWIDIDGFSLFGFTFVNDDTTDSVLIVQWSNDGVNLHGEEVLVAGEGKYKTVDTRKHARYMRVKLVNNHTAPHTMSAWTNMQVYS